jgi:hypothetical protein
MDTKRTQTPYAELPRWRTINGERKKLTAPLRKYVIQLDRMLLAGRAVDDLVGDLTFSSAALGMIFRFFPRAAVELFS